VSGFTSTLDVRLLNDRTPFPWMTLEPLEYYSELTGETYTVPKYFRTDGASVPAAIVALPLVGPALFLRFFGQGVFQGFKQGVLHDWLRRTNVVPAAIAHRILREALYAANYPPDLCENYYAAVVAFNSSNAGIGI
jgi:hypothetical protein